ncbi:MAG: chromosome segregation protein SMC [Chloroflexi bacterium]|nr:chromosome segregation protein SMC [Chloroflexota bacterium]
MYLRRLDLLGFKTFAVQTTFEFNSGITAIVGPNGSGKSNIADAVRWVTGEQSLRLLRAKRSEDLIFAGGASRASLGMAEVSLTFDNGQHFLPFPYSEITLTRRLYRSGESQYFLNRQRVRLRDVTDLLLKSGLGQNTYAVIGQGLVDSILSLKPEDRRAFFEEAADIKRHQIKLAEAQSKLAITEQNVIRANDVASEILPRLAHLEKQAKQARERDALSHELTESLRTMFTHRWRHAALECLAMRRQELRIGQTLAACEDEQTSVASCLTQLHAMQTQKTEAIAALRGQMDVLRARGEEVQRLIAVGQERVSSCRRQIDDLTQELAEMESGEASERAAQDAAEEQLELLAREVGDAASGCAAQVRELETVRARRREVGSRVECLETDSRRSGNDTNALRAELSRIADRRLLIQNEIAGRDPGTRQRDLQLAEIAHKIATVESEAARLDDSANELANELKNLDASLVSHQSAQRQMDENLAVLARQRQENATHLDLLRRWEQTHSGFYSGVKAVLEASQARSNRAPGLTGIVDIVGKLITAPSSLETAIEVALGSHIQDVVVDRWKDAEEAIAYLKRTSSGRATFLPLDTVKAQSVAAPASTGAGMIGLAARLVSYDPRFKTVVDYLLGRTLVVETLPVARQALKVLPSGWQIVTQAGEIVRSSGAVTGGSVGSGSRILGRERELRDLPAAIRQIESAIGVAEEELTGLKAEYRRLQSRRSQLQTSLAETRMQRHSKEHALGALRDEEKRLGQEAELYQSLRCQMEGELLTLDERERAIELELSRVVEESTASAALLVAEQHEVQALLEHEQHLAATLAELRTELAVVRQKKSNHEETLMRQRQSLERIDGQIAAKRTKLEELRSLATAHQRDLADSLNSIQEMSAELQSLDTAINSAQSDIERSEEERNRLLCDQNDVRARLQGLQFSHQKATFDAQRAEDEVGALRAQIANELGEDWAKRDALAPRRHGPTRTPVLRRGTEGHDGEGEEDLRDVPRGVQEPDLTELKRHIDQIREKLRVLQGVNPRAVEEYEEALARYDFLTSQARDLQQAANSLRQIILELRKTMKAKFEETFRSVANRFREYFVTLFGGGTARLVLTDPKDISQTGVEIVAQPPGKRMQSLAALSGGERALSAVALLFAILKVNPTPVCVLDEVDAALDESNVARFCEALKGLAERTQFIVITHNRGTMEIADGLYGISMTDSCTSRVLSLRLPPNGHRNVDELEPLQPITL